MAQSTEEVVTNEVGWGQVKGVTMEGGIEKSKVKSDGKRVILTILLVIIFFVTIEPPN